MRLDSITHFVFDEVARYGSETIRIKVLGAALEVASFLRRFYLLHVLTLVGATMFALGIFGLLLSAAISYTPGFPESVFVIKPLFWVSVSIVLISVFSLFFLQSEKRILKAMHVDSFLRKMQKRLSRETSQNTNESKVTIETDELLARLDLLDEKLNAFIENSEVHRYH